MKCTYELNVLDKIKIKIPTEITDDKWIKSDKGLGYEYYTKKDEGLIVTLSGKFMASHDDLGSLYKGNIKDVITKLNLTVGLSLTTSDFLKKCQILSVDVKRDILVDGADCRPYISAIREIAKKNSRYKDIIGFKQKSCSYEESLLIKTTTKKKKKSLSIYSKYAELIHRRRKDKEYFDLFSKKFLEKCKRLLRFEVRLNSFEDMRNAFGIPDGNVYLCDLFKSKKDVVANAYQELVLGE